MSARWFAVDAHRPAMAGRHRWAKRNTSRGEGFNKKLVQKPAALPSLRFSSLHSLFPHTPPRRLLTVLRRTLRACWQGIYGAVVLDTFARWSYKNGRAHNLRPYIKISSANGGHHKFRIEKGGIAALFHSSGDVRSSTITFSTVWSATCEAVSRKQPLSADSPASGMCSMTSVIQPPTEV